MDTRVVGFQGFYESRFLDSRLLFRTESLWLDRRDNDNDIATFYQRRYPDTITGTTIVFCDNQILSHIDQTTGKVT